MLLIMTACNTGMPQAIITGNIIDQNPSEFEYTVPINGIDYFGFKENVNPDSLGNFRIVIETAKPAVVEFIKGVKGYGAVIIEPGIDYDISINTRLKEGAFIIRCKNEAALPSGSGPYLSAA